jgi:DNA polymerase-3 subunit gamma/tau
MLTNEAFNALLKTLEEPPAHALFILCTTQPEKLPETIISRCQRINFNLAKDKEIVRSLARIVKGEKLNVDKKTLSLIAKKAEGSFRDAAKILQQLSFESKRISFKKAKDELEKEVIFAKDILTAMEQRKQQQALSIIAQAMARGIDLRFLTQQILELLRDILLEELGVTKKTIKASFSQEETKRLIDLFDNAGRNLRGAVIPQLPLEMAVIDYFQKEEVIKPAQATMPDSIEGKWAQVLGLVKNDNHSIEALLKSTKAVKIKGDNLVVEVFYKFHHQELSKREKKELVEKRAKQIFGKKINIKYQMKGK